MKVILLAGMIALAATPALAHSAVDATRALAADIASYEPGDTVVFHGHAYGCEANDVCTVTGKRDGRVILLHPDGGERSFHPAGNAKNYLGLFDTERIELRSGERIRWTRNRKPPKPRGGNPPARSARQTGWPPGSMPAWNGATGCFSGPATRSATASRSPPSACLTPGCGARPVGR